MRVRAITAKQFERWCHRSFEKDGDARKQIAECHSAKVLFIDDIGKEKYTERVESEFYDLVEHRTSHLSPILWTANATGQELEQMMGEDRGVPVVRRLREFTEIISV
jgi:DNA replication protein DnaC